MYKIYVYVFICASAYTFHVLCTFCCLLLSPLRSLILRNASRKPLWRLAAKSFGNHLVLHLAQAEKVLWGTTKSRWFEARLAFYTHNPVSGLGDLGIQHDSTIFCTTLMKKKKHISAQKRWLFKKVITGKTRGFFPPGKPPKPPFGDSWAPLDRRRLLLGMEVSCLSNRSGGLFFPYFKSASLCWTTKSDLFYLYLSAFFRVQSRYCSTLTIWCSFACENCPSLTFHHFC